MTIPGRCFTNLDEFQNVEWPEEFVAVPRVGERVRGRRGAQLPELYVVAVAHAVGRRDLIGGPLGPYIVVELHHYTPGLKP